MNTMPRLSPTEEADLEILREVMQTGDEDARQYLMRLPTEYRAYLLQLSRIELGMATIEDVLTV